jgi:DNA-binding MarR family transcriptional regulator
MQVDKHAYRNLARERVIPTAAYTLPKSVEQDWIDRIVDRWSELQPDIPSDAYHVTGRISRIAARIAERQELLFGRYGLNRGDIGVLSALRTSPPPHRMSPSQLFRGLMLSSAGITKRLDRLEARGLVKRNPDPNDRRGVSIQLTEEGRKLVNKAVAENTKSEATLLDGLTQKERRQLAELLRKLLSVAEPSAGG